MKCSSFNVVALAAVAGLGASIASAAVIVEFRTVGNAGNAGDPGNFGSGAVAYEYRIGTFEVTNAQYAEFLNAVAASDPRGLYNPKMGTNPRGGITRAGTDGSFTYAVRPNMGNKPVNFVNFLDAARMANWLTNGQGSGSTESGVYTLSGSGIGAVTAITRDLSNPKQVFLPTLDEWNKAAFHRPATEGGDTDNFWKFATQSNDQPGIATATPTGDIANPGPNIVNWRLGADWNGQNGNLTTVGSAGNASFYGAFDMAGNVDEWCETVNLGGRAITGGAYFAVPTFGIRPEDAYFGLDTPELDFTGFRFASPEPAVIKPCPGDLNADSFVDDSDFVVFAAAYNLLECADPSMPPGCPADLTGDAFVDDADFVLFAAAYDALVCP